MLRAALPCVLVAALRGQAASDELFRREPGREPPHVSAERNAVPADQALRGLAHALRWQIEFETVQLVNDLSRTSLDLALVDQSPRTVAHLLAVAGGADVTFDDRDSEDGRTTTLHVVRPATPDSETGRERLRRWAAGWYETFLAEDSRLDPLVKKESIAVRMNLGVVLMKQGDLESAARVFESVWKEDQSHPTVPKALLRLAECLHELGKDAQAEIWAKELKKRNPALEETADATVLLGKILLELGKADSARYDECVRTLDGMLLPLADAPQVVDVLLLIGEAHLRRAEPGRALHAMELLWSAHDYQKLSERQMLDYWFLRGSGAEGIGKHDEAMEALEWFLGLGDSDRRRGAAFVLLGHSYLALGRFVEARSAALEASALARTLTPEWQQKARFLEANAMLALGDRDRALEDLGVQVRKAPHESQEQVLFLVDKLIEVGRYQKAVQAAELLRDVKSKHADLVRTRAAQALFQQAEASGALKGYPAAAIALAGQIDDTELKRTLAELIGKAYESLGEVDRAADAYRGILR